MNIRGGGITIGGLKRWLAHLLLLAVAVRALIPIGYMPDFAAAGDGVFKVVICSGMGAKQVALDADGKPLPDQQASNDGQPCAFAGVAVVALPILDALPLPAPDFQTAALSARTAVDLPPARAGPALGSRGPPQVS